jgi:hypothetical protein
MLGLQLEALHRDLGWEVRLYANSDTKVLVREAARQAYADGFEHIAVLSESMKVAETEWWLRREAGKLFESIEVVPEHTPRIQHKMSTGPLRLIEGALDSVLGPTSAQAAPTGRPAAPQAAAKPGVLVVLNMQPPRHGHAIILQAVEAALKSTQLTNQARSLLFLKAGDGEFSVTSRIKLMGAHPALKDEDAGWAQNTIAPSAAANTLANWSAITVLSAPDIAQDALAFVKSVAPNGVTVTPLALTVDASVSQNTEGQAANQKILTAAKTLGEAGRKGGEEINAERKKGSEGKAPPASGSGGLFKEADAIQPVYTGTPADFMPGRPLTPEDEYTAYLAFQASQLQLGKINGSDDAIKGSLGSLKLSLMPGDKEALDQAADATGIKDLMDVGKALTGNAKGKLGSAGKDQAKITPLMNEIIAAGYSVKDIVQKDGSDNPAFLSLRKAVTGN